MEKPILLRPHHGMCLAYFVGKGYSEGFSSHMGKILNLLEHNVPVKLVVRTDAICAACPNHQDQVCTSYGNSKEYDFVELQKEQNLIFWNLLEWWKKRFLNQDCDVRFADNAGGMTFAAAKKAAGRTYKIKMMVLQNKMINQVTNTAHNMKQIFRNL